MDLQCSAKGLIQTQNVKTTPALELSLYPQKTSLCEEFKFLYTLDAISSGLTSERHFGWRGCILFL